MERASCEVLTSSNERKLIFCEMDGWVLGGRAVWGVRCRCCLGAAGDFSIIDGRVLGHAVWVLVQVPFLGAVWGAAWVDGLVLGGQVTARAHFARLTVGC